MSSKKKDREVKIVVGNGTPFMRVKQRRNQACACGSGVKQKRCCGDETKYFHLPKIRKEAET